MLTVATSEFSPFSRKPQPEISGWGFCLGKYDGVSLLTSAALQGAGCGHHQPPKVI